MISYKGSKGQLIEKRGVIEGDYFCCEGSGESEKIRFVRPDGSCDPLPWLSEAGNGNSYCAVERELPSGARVRIQVYIKVSLL